jgi:hypothetical protein
MVSIRDTTAELTEALHLRRFEELSSSVFAIVKTSNSGGCEPGKKFEDDVGQFCLW